MRPLSLRLFITLRPPDVFIRARKPAFLERLRLLGLYVRFGISKLYSTYEIYDEAAYLSTLVAKRAAQYHLYMNISWQQLHHLPVLTESGQKIGQVDGVSVNLDSHSVLHYHVQPSRSILGLFSKELLVSPALVVSMDDKAMIVKDAVMQADPATANKKTRLAFSAPKGVEMSERD